MWDKWDILGSLAEWYQADSKGIRYENETPDEIIAVFHYNEWIIVEVMYQDLDQPAKRGKLSEMG